MILHWAVSDDYNRLVHWLDPIKLEGKTVEKKRDQLEENNARNKITGAPFINMDPGKDK